MAASRKPPPDSATRLRAAVGQGIADLARACGAVRPVVRLGYSGGLDSSVLLALLAVERDAGAIALEAVHVHHGLSPHADGWSGHCRARCAELAVPLAVEHVDVARAGGQSLEEQARERRYDVLTAPGCDAVALAHHADDLTETMLLQWLRGAGPRGLAAMPALYLPAARRGTARLWRPLLRFTRAELAGFAAERGLHWIDDESNARTEARRNYLRHRVMPALREGFPALREATGRAARLQAEAAGLLDELAAIDLHAAGRDGDDGLDCTHLKTLTTARLANALRVWIADAGARAPSAARLAALVKAIGDTSNDTRLEWRHDGLRVVRRKVWLKLERDTAAD